jgi:hypothetical protein
MADFSARTPLRVLPPDEIERMLAEHRLYGRLPVCLPGISALKAIGRATIGIWPFR